MSTIATKGPWQLLPATQAFSGPFSDTPLKFLKSRQVPSSSRAHCPDWCPLENSKYKVPFPGFLICSCKTEQWALLKSFKWEEQHRTDINQYPVLFVVSTFSVGQKKAQTAAQQLVQYQLEQILVKWDEFWFSWCTYSLALSLSMSYLQIIVWAPYLNINHQVFWCYFDPDGLGWVGKFLKSLCCVIYPSWVP